MVTATKINEAAVQSASNTGTDDMPLLYLTAMRRWKTGG